MAGTLLLAIVLLLLTTLLIVNSIYYQRIVGAGGNNEVTFTEAKALFWANVVGAILAGISLIGVIFYAVFHKRCAPEIEVNSLMDAQQQVVELSNGPAAYYGPRPPAADARGDYQCVWKPKV